MPNGRGKAYSFETKGKVETCSTSPGTWWYEEKMRDEGISGVNSYMDRIKASNQDQGGCRQKRHEAVKDDCAS